MLDDEIHGLPPQSSAYEMAVEQTSAERWKALDTDIINRVRDPWQCPEHLLNFLAYERSVDIWNPNWPVWKKRSVIASAPQDHLKKTTLAGIRRYLEIADVELIYARAPGGFRVGASMTDAERLAWLNRFPEIRVYRERRRFPMKGMVIGKCPLGVNGVPPATPYGPGFLHPDDAESYAVPQAFLWDHGVEVMRLNTSRRITDVAQMAVEDELTIRIPQKMRGFVLGRSLLGRAHLIEDNAADRVHTIRTRSTQAIPGESRLAMDLIRPNYPLMDVRSELVFERFTLKGMILGRKRVGVVHLHPDRAVDHIFSRTRLFDPLRPLEKRKSGGSVLGRDYIKIPPHNGILRVRIRQKLQKRAIIIGRPLAGFISPKLNDAYELALNAIRSAQRLSDRLYVETRTIDVAKVGSGLTIGQFKIGQMKDLL